MIKNFSALYRIFSRWSFYGLIASLFCIAQEVHSGDTPLPISAGDRAPEFTLKDFTGKPFVFSRKERSKVRVFWFTNLCSGCQSVIGEMEKIKNDYEKKGVEIVLVSVLGTERASVESVIKQRGLSLRFLYDPDGKVTSLYSGKFVQGTCPLRSLYLIKKDGTVKIAKHFPGIPPAILRSEIEEALSTPG